MSRNFELLSQLHRERELFQRPLPPDTAGSHDKEESPLAEIDKRLFEVAAPVSGVSAEAESAKLAGFLGSETSKLVQRVFLAPRSTTFRSVVFSTVERGDQCDWISAQVGDLLASSTRDSICLVDADLVSPSLHSYFGVENRRGLAESLVDPGPIEGFIRPSGRERLQLMCAGELSPGTDLNALLASGRLRARFSELMASYPYVVVNAPPATGNFMTSYLAALADGLILIAEPYFTSRQAACDAKENVQAAGGRVLGVVLYRRAVAVPGWAGQIFGIPKPVWNS
jgi:Mrp family chromosome partitioning ATPase